MNLVINYYTISSFSIVLSCLLVISILKFKKFKSTTSNSFIIFSIIALGWSFFYLLWQLSYDFDHALIFTKLLMFFAALIPSSYLLVSLALTNQINEKKTRLIVSYIISTIIGLLSFSNLIVLTLGKNKYHSLWPLAGSMLDVFLIVWFAILAYSDLLLYESYRIEGDKQKKNQILVLMIGFSLSFLGGATNFFLWYNIQFPPMGNFVGPIFFVFIAYAIIKLGFLDFDTTKSHISTFWNDILSNPFKGFSVVSDLEIFNALKDFQNYSVLEDCNLLNLSLTKKISKTKKLSSVDALRYIIQEAIEYFKPNEDIHRRTKVNLKYHLLKMIAYDQAEEGQILWELGFDEYPVRIMSNSNRQRPPLFETKSPSDYFYTSRNAYLALKKEAIHDVTWRISYLEKQSKRKIFIK